MVPWRAYHSPPPATCKAPPQTTKGPLWETHSPSTHSARKNEKEFAPVKITLSDGTEVTLLSLLRLKGKDRKAVLEALDALEADDEASTSDEVDLTLATALTVLELVAKDNGKKLVKELGDDLALTMKVLNAWTAATQVGEAGNSPS